MKKLFLGYYNKSVILTYIGAISAVIGMAFSLSGKMKYALICLIVCGVSDLFDGMIARRCKRTDEEKEFGIQIDSLNDMVSFALFPVIISLSMGFDAWYYIAVYSFYVLASITRLGFFNVSASIESETKFYTGLPVTFASLIVVCMFIIGKITGIGNILIPISIFVMGLLFILKIKIMKPRGIAYIFLGLLAIALLIAVILIGE